MVVRPELVAQPRLTRASARYALPRGEVVLSWARGALCAGEATGPATFSLNVSVPVNSAARVTVPLGACGKGMITESGAQVWPTVSVGEAAPAGFLLGERGGAQPDHLPDGIAAITFDVGSGSYAFHAQ
jgi:hypothetical protein